MRIRVLDLYCLSTPSLGITWEVVERFPIEIEFNFQLPLSGSQIKDEMYYELREWAAFQLPLSGSPSPIPGFFGSPRRSAAAPLRTNDF
jgi:hypothetical protein